MERNLTLELVRTTEAAAIAAARWIGKGDEREIDAAAHSAIKKALEECDFRGRVVVREENRGHDDSIRVGDVIGRGNGDQPEIELAVDPLDGTTLAASGGPNALSVIAAAPEGSFLQVPDIYMDKIIVGPEGKGAIDLEATPTENLQRLAKAKNKPIEELTALILDRPRHDEIIDEVRRAGARVGLLGDGDLSAALAMAAPNSGVDILLGIGGATEGVLAAAALKSVGGDMQGRLILKSDQDRKAAIDCGIDPADLGRIYSLDEIAKGDDVVFAATGVTSGDYLGGVEFCANQALTHSVVMRTLTGTVRKIDTIRNL